MQVAYHAIKVSQLPDRPYERPEYQVVNVTSGCNGVGLWDSEDLSVWCPCPGLCQIADQVTASLASSRWAVNVRAGIATCQHYNFRNKSALVDMRIA